MSYCDDCMALGIADCADCSVGNRSAQEEAQNHFYDYELPLIEQAIQDEIDAEDLAITLNNTGGVTSCI